LQFGKKLVVFAVGDELATYDVISVVVPADFSGEFGVAFLGGDVGHVESLATTALIGTFFINTRFQPGGKCARRK
jgi:hypothetical protein